MTGAVTRWAVAVLCGLTGLAGASPGYAADGDPPPLPSGGSQCVGPSPVTYQKVPWPLVRLSPHHAWPLSRGKGVTVAVVDTGVGTPPGLKGAVKRGRDMVANGRADNDCLGRGTALADLVAGRPGGGYVFGVAPEASVLPIRISDGDGRVPPDALAKGIRAAAGLGADVILVGAAVETDDSALRSAVAKAVHDDALVVAPVAARGEDKGYPAAYKQVVSVGGVDADGRPSESQRAELYAPGYGIVAVGGSGHYLVGGPAVAAAYVAGAAALVRAYHPDLDQAEVRQRLLLTASARTLDPYAAVADLEPERATRTPELRRGAVTVPEPPGTDPALSRSLWYAGALLLATLAVLAAVAVVRSRRRRAA
jgi:hypothetical protein